MNNVLSAILAVFLSVGEWISSAVNTLTPMFWANNSLTFVGVLAVSSLALAVSLLILYLISSFIKFRG